MTNGQTERGGECRGKVHGWRERKGVKECEGRVGKGEGGKVRSGEKKRKNNKKNRITRTTARKEERK